MFPKLENVETPLGTADEVWATSSTHVGMRGTFEINRNRYRVRLDLHYRGGEWQRGDKDDWSAVYHALMVDREWDYPGGKKRPDTSDSARKKAETLVAWLAAFAVGDGAEIIRAAGIDAHAAAIASKEAQIAKLTAEIAEATRELAELRN